MICPHCGTLLVEDRFMDWTARWRCLKCGRVQDSVSVESHLARQREHVLRKDVQPDYLNEEARVGSESIIQADATMSSAKGPTEIPPTATQYKTPRPAY